MPRTNYNYPVMTLHREFKTNDVQYLEVDGAVLSLRLLASVDGESAEHCLPTIDDLRRAPIRTAHRHLQPKPALREPLFHENEIVSDVSGIGGGGGGERFAPSYVCDCISELDR